jgi:hypothetical protein
MAKLLFGLEARAKAIVKPLLFRDAAAPRRIRFGPGRGVVLMLNRRHELQKELGLWEIETQPLYARWVRPGTTVFDVGAAEGDSTMILAKLAAPGRVVAFEPDADLRRRLAENAALNPQLPVPEVMPVWVGARDADARDDGTRTVALDSIVAAARVPAPGFVKIDVDGAELDVLSGMEGLLRDRWPALVVEVHSADLERACLDFLAARSYAVSVVRNAWWRTFYPEHRGTGLNRWLLALPKR